jgi:hypothetical protein
MLGKKETMKALRQELYSVEGITAVRTTELAQARPGCAWGRGGGWGRHAPGGHSQAC